MWTKINSSTHALVADAITHRPMVTPSGQLAIPIEWDTYVSALLSGLATILPPALLVLLQLVTARTGNLAYSNLQLSHMLHVLRRPTWRSSATMVVLLVFLVARLTVGPSVRATFKQEDLVVHKSTWRGLYNGTGHVMRLRDLQSQFNSWNNVTARTSVRILNVSRSREVLTNLTAKDVDKQSSMMEIPRFGRLHISGITGSAKMFWPGNACDPVEATLRTGGENPSLLIFSGSGTIVQPTALGYTLLVHFMVSEVSYYRSDRNISFKAADVYGTQKDLYYYDLDGTTVFMAPLTTMKREGQDNGDELLYRVEVLEGTPAWFNRDGPVCGMDDSLSIGALLAANLPALQNTSAGFAAMVYYDARHRGKFVDYQDPASPLMPANYLAATIDAVSRGGRNNDVGLQFLLTALLDDDATLLKETRGTFWVLTGFTYALLLLFILPVPLLFGLKFLMKEELLMSDLYHMVVSSTHEPGIKNERGCCGYGSSKLKLRNDVSLDKLYLNVNPSSMALSLMSTEEDKHAKYQRGWWQEYATRHHVASTPHTPAFDGSHGNHAHLYVCKVDDPKGLGMRDHA